LVNGYDAAITTDPALASFLALLDQDIVESPEGILTLDEGLMRRAEAQTKGVVSNADKDFSEVDFGLSQLSFPLWT
jgi:hypothetical protein